MYRIVAVCLTLMAGIHLQAQSIALSGTVTDPEGKPVKGAIVTLESKSLSDTTDAGGTFSLTGEVSHVNMASPHTSSEFIALKNGFVVVQLAQQSLVRIEFFDMQGNLLERVAEKSDGNGTYRFDPGSHRLSPNMLIIRITAGKHSTHFRYMPLLSGFQAISARTNGTTGTRLAKMQAALDNIEATALGYTPKTVPITSYSETVNIVLTSSFTGTCTPSRRFNSDRSGSGPHDVIVETNSDPGIREGTIFRPADLGGNEKYPIFVWGEGGCGKNGMLTAASMTEIASHGYFVIADGTPTGGGNRPMLADDLEEMGRPALAYITWIIAENRKPCSAYYQSIDTSKVGSNGFSCGGLFAMGTASDPRITTWGLTSSGSFSDNEPFWNTVHTPVLIIQGHKDMPPLETGAYANGLRDFNGIAPLGWPVYFISNKNMGHGGDLFNAPYGGEFTKINLAWLNWWLKGDEGETGKGVLVGSGCSYCTDNNWQVMSANLPE